MQSLDLERIGFWGMLALYVVRDGIIPIATKYFPSLSKKYEREEARKDKALEFDNQMRLRQTEALENISRFMELSNERLSHIEEKLRILPRSKKSRIA